MWILHFLPDALILWFCNILLVVGLVLTAAGFFAHRIPVIWQYQLPFKILGIALLTLGVYFRGGYAVEAEWRERVAEVEARLAVAEQKSVATNQKIDRYCGTGKDSCDSWTNTNCATVYRQRSCAIRHKIPTRWAV